MRVVFMGTPDISATCLRRLLTEHFDVVAVFTKPDTKQNRGMKLEQSPVKQLAAQAGIPVFQPATFRDETLREQLTALKPDVIAVVAYGKILPQWTLDIPPLGCVNIHASVLPALRGAGPVQWAILNGLAETGVTAMYMAAAMDAGDIIEIRKTPIDPDENAQSLLDRLAEIGAELLCDTLRAVESGTAKRTPQDDSQATLAPMLTKALCPLDWSKPVRELHNQVRGLDPWPVATARLFDTNFKIYKLCPTDKTTDKPAGTPLAVTKQGLEIACGDGVAVITVLQAEGGKRMPAPDYFRGHPAAL